MLGMACVQSICGGFVSFDAAGKGKKPLFSFLAVTAPLTHKTLLLFLNSFGTRFRVVSFPFLSLPFLLWKVIVFFWLSIS
jgi:hypothetical protein